MYDLLVDPAAMASSSLDLNALGAACWITVLNFDGEGMLIVWA